MTDHWDRAAHAQMVIERARAHTIQCRYCMAPQGEPCVNQITGEPLGRQPAHIVRLQDVGA